MDLIIASNNAHKIAEIRQILGDRFTLYTLADKGLDVDVAETADTFLGNALLKAQEICRLTGSIALADDTGLCVDALGGAPGVYSARYAGEGGNDGRNVAKLLGKLAGIEDRRARFVCVIALASHNGLIGTAEGEVRGTIAAAPAGNGGFGYDPVFIPDGYERTFGELPPEIKNRLSHRANALKAAVPLIEKLLNS